jgi:suppressor of ftsI
MRPALIDRREFLTSGLTLVGTAVLGGSTLACSSDQPLAPQPLDLATAKAVIRDEDLADPPILSSVGGLLSAAITCGTVPTMVGGRLAREAVTYNGLFPGPTLWARQGDTLDLGFTNRIVFDQASDKPGYGRPPRDVNATNLHFHGVHVSPLGSADNMLVMVQPNRSHRYLFEVPRDHPAGCYWYHAHVHGLVTNHVSRGAAGMIYIANAYTDRIESLGIRRRLMLLQQAYFEEDLKTVVFDDGERDDAELALSLINGVRLPDIRIRPGEPQVWCLVNGSSSAFYALRLEGHTFDVIGEDGVPLVGSGRRGQQMLLLPSGKRLEVVVRGARMNGRYALSYDAYNQGVDIWPQKTIGTLVVDGPSWTGADHPGVDSSAPPQDLSTVSVSDDLKRTIVFGVNRNVPEGEFGRFTINGHSWNPNYSEWTSTLGTTEEWFIRNDTEQDHPFHVHVNPFQITKVNGVAVPFEGYQDTASVPRFGSITVRTRFTDFAGGPILMHCHILDHEDMGMMTRFEIAPAGGAL